MELAGSCRTGVQQLDADLNKECRSHRISEANKARRQNLKQRLSRLKQNVEQIDQQAEQHRLTGVSISSAFQQLRTVTAEACEGTSITTALKTLGKLRATTAEHFYHKDLEVHHGRAVQLLQTQAHGMQPPRGTTFSSSTESDDHELQIGQDAGALEQDRGGFHALDEEREEIMTTSSSVDEYANQQLGQHAAALEADGAWAADEEEEEEYEGHGPEDQVEDIMKEEIVKEIDDEFLTEHPYDADSAQSKNGAVLRFAAEEEQKGEFKDVSKGQGAPVEKNASGRAAEKGRGLQRVDGMNIEREAPESSFMKITCKSTQTDTADVQEALQLVKHSEDLDTAEGTLDEVQVYSEPAAVQDHVQENACIRPYKEDIDEEDQVLNQKLMDFQERKNLESLHVEQPSLRLLHIFATVGPPERACRRLAQMHHQESLVHEEESPEGDPKLHRQALEERAAAWAAANPAQRRTLDEHLQDVEDRHRERAGNLRRGLAREVISKARDNAANADSHNLAADPQEIQDVFGSDLRRLLSQYGASSGSGGIWGKRADVREEVLSEIAQELQTHVNSDENASDFVEYLPETVREATVGRRQVTRKRRDVGVLESLPLYCQYAMRLPPGT